MVASCRKLQVDELPEAFFLVGGGDGGAVFGKSDGILEAVWHECGARRAVQVLRYLLRRDQ
jgi:hypothetical protein